jgi:hypothetical protein
VEGSCVHGDESLGSIKCWELVELLSDWQLLRKKFSYILVGYFLRWDQFRLVTSLTWKFRRKVLG